MKAVCIIVSLFLGPPVHFKTVEKPFDSIEECQLWVYRQDFLPPYEGVQSWYYCEDKQ